MPFDLARAGIPFDARHCSRREFRGPCVDIFPVEKIVDWSRSMPSIVTNEIYLLVTRRTTDTQAGVNIPSCAESDCCGAT